MDRTTASELQVGDIFYRELYRPPDPAVDWRYTVRAIQHVPLHDFFGKPLERIQISADSHLTGPQRLNLGPDDPVWLVERPLPGAAVADAGGGQSRSLRRWASFTTRAKRRS